MAGAEGEEVIEDDLANTARKKRKRTLVTVVIVVLVAAVAGLGFALTQKNHTASASAVRATTTTTTISIPTTPTSTTVPTTYPPKSPCSSRSACISDTPCTASALADAFQSTGAAANGGSIPTDVVPTGSPLCVTTTGDGPFAFLNFNSPSVGSVSAVFNTQDGTDCHGCTDLWEVQAIGTDFSCDEFTTDEIQAFTSAGESLCSTTGDGGDGTTPESSGSVTAQSAYQDGYDTGQTSSAGFVSGGESEQTACRAVVVPPADVSAGLSGDWLTGCEAGFAAGESSNASPSAPDVQPYNGGTSGGAADVPAYSGGSYAGGDATGGFSGAP